MSKKIIYIIISLLISIILVGFIYLYFKNENQPSLKDNGSSFFPEIPFLNNNESVNNTTTSNNSTENEISNRRLILENISDSSGDGFILNSSSTDIMLSYINNEGNLFLKNLSNNETGIDKKISNLTISGRKKIKGVINNNKVSFIIENINKDRETTYHFITQDLDDSINDKNYKIIKNNIIDYTFSPEKTSVFYLEEKDGETIGYIEDIDFSKKEAIFNSLYSSWVVDWYSINNILLKTKPHFDVLGYAYLFNTQNTSQSKLIGDILGLQILMSPDNNYYLYAENSKNNTNLFLVDIENDVTKNLNIKTWLDKCTWNTDSTYIYCGKPENEVNGFNLTEWYKGKITTSDTIWRINLEGNEEDLILDPNSLGKSIDINNIKYIKNIEEYLIFNNKKDSSIYRLSI